MATTTNFGWETPDDTDLVKDGAAAIRTLGSSIDTTMATMVAKTVVDAKGDLIAATAADTVSRLQVGANGSVLTADSAEATGLKWVAPASGGKVLQVVYGSTVTYSGSASATFADTGLTATITPTSTSSKILVLVSQNGIGHSNSASGTSLMLQIVRGATVHSLTNSAGNSASNSTVYGLSVSGSWLDSPATTSATTYKTQYASFNSQSAVYVQDDSKAANVNRSTITLLEIGA